MHLRPVVTILTIGATLLAACAPGAPGGATASSSAGGAQVAGGAARGGAGTGTRRPAGQVRPGPGQLTRVEGEVRMVMPEGVWLTSGANFGLTPQTQVTRGVSQDPADLREGDLVSVFALRSPDGTLQASEVNLLPARPAAGQEGQARPGQGAAGPRGGQGPGAAGRQGGQGPGAPQATGSGNQGRPPAASGNAPAAGPRGGFMGERTLKDGTVAVTGTVQRLEGGRLTVAAGDQTTQVAVSPDTVVQRREPGSVDDLKPGVHISALLVDGDALMVNLR